MAYISELKNGKLSCKFESVPEVFKVIDRLGWKPQQERASDRSGKGDSFYGFGSLSEAVDIFRNHPERIRDFSQNDDKLEKIESPGKDVLFDVTGDYLDMDLYMEGVPEVFGNAVMGNPKSTFATINILGSYVYYTDKGYQTAKQKRVLRLVDWLETQDIRCQIVLSEDSEVSSLQTVVKEFQDPFDLNHLAVAMHPDWLRRVEFLIMEQSKTWSYGYGSSVQYDKRMLKYKPEPEDGFYIYVGGYMPYSDQGPNGSKEMEKAFDEIEANIREAIDLGMTFSEKPLVVAGNTRGW